MLTLYNIGVVQPGPVLNYIGTCDDINRYVYMNVHTFLDTLIVDINIYFSLFIIGKFWTLNKNVKDREWT